MRRRRSGDTRLWEILVVRSRASATAALAGVKQGTSTHIPLTLSRVACIVSERGCRVPVIPSISLMMRKEIDGDAGEANVSSENIIGSYIFALALPAVLK